MFLLGCAPWKHSNHIARKPRPHEEATCERAFRPLAPLRSQLTPSIHGHRSERMSFQVIPASSISVTS